MSLLRRRRGVSGIISGLFLVGVAVMLFSTLYWQIMRQDHYNQIVLERMQREWERFNERIEILETGYGSYLRFKIVNLGGVTAHLVTVYLNDTTLDIPRALVLSNYLCTNSSAWVSPGTERWIYTTIPVISGNSYSLKVATERGNLAMQPMTATLSGGGAQSVPAVVTFNQLSFQYTTKTLYPSWSEAWVKPGQSGPNHQIYRINITNVTGKDIVLNKSSHMRQEADDVSDVEAVWWVVDPNTNPNNNNPTVFTSQTIPKGTWSYVHFAASLEGGNNWQGDPTASHYYIVFIHIFFNYQGESVYYGLTVSVMSQKIT